MYSGIILAFAIMLANAQKPKPIIDTIVIQEEFVKAPRNELPEDFEYFCQCVEAEAGDHDYLGKCYVADVILNRLEQWNLESITAVINQHRTRANGSEEWQFEVVKNGRINRVKVSEETRRACMDELKERKNTEILYFCMYDWFDWAEWLFKYPESGHNVHHFYKEK